MGRMGRVAPGNRGLDDDIGKTADGMGTELKGF